MLSELQIFSVCKMEDTDYSSTDSPVKGGVKIPVDVPPNARNALKPSPKILPKPRERARSFAIGSASANRAQGEQSGVVKPSTATVVTNQSDASQWKTKALNFHDQIAREVERLVQTVEDKEAANKAIDALKKARIPQGNRRMVNPEKFLGKADQVVTLLQRIQLQHPPILQPPPTKQKTKRPNVPNIGRLSPTRLQQINLESTIMIGHHRRFDVPATTNLASAELGKGSAIPLCLPNDTEWDQQRNRCKRLEGVERTTLVLNPQALEILRSISGPVCVIAIVGPCRSGKSYILSRLISSTGEKCHFDLGHEMDPKTMGIWMWDQPFKMKLNNFKEEVTIILLDTEGIDAANATDQGDSQIFTLSVLLSSLMIYNSMSVPKREDLNQMHFVANLSKSIQVQAGKSAAGKEGVKMADSNPRFMWLLRDVILMPTDKNGKPCHIKDHLLQKVLVEDATDDETQKGIRQCILSFFNAFDAETLPPPSTDPHVMWNIENPLYQKEISPAFLHKVEYVRKRIFDNCVPKKGFTGGSIVSGFQLAHMVQLYVDALNSPGGIPVIGSTWQRVLEATYTDGMERAIKIYSEVMERAAQSLPMEDEKLLMNHRKGIEESMKTFNQAASLDSESELYQTYLDKLMAKLAVFDDNGDCISGHLAFYLEKNYGKSKSECQTLIKDLKEQHLDPLIKMLTPETDFKTIETAFMTLISLYNEKCRGPASEDVLTAFIQEQEKQRDQLETQLKTIKNYDDQAKQRMKELKEQRCLMEQKEIETKQRMEQSKRDQEAKLQALKDKYAKDAEKLRNENSKQMQEQEKRLRNMAEANLKKVRDENSQQMTQLRTALEQKERELKQHNDRIAAEIRRKQEEARRLREQQEAARKRKRKKGGCFAPGTKVALTNGEDLNIEKQTEGVKILALGGETATITDEFVEAILSDGEQLVGFNDDTPFAALHHPFWTTEGWKCLDPKTAKEENPDVDFKLLQVGDIIFRIAQTEPLLYKPTKIHKFTFLTLQEPTKIYGLHLDGPRSYHANGYAVMANYPVLTKKRVQEGMKKLSEEEKESLQSTLSSVKVELTKVLGSWANDAFDDIGLTVRMIKE